MDKVILIKYGELTTKKQNRNFFINTLYNNIKNKLKNYDVKIVENYHDNGDSFTASVSFLPKEKTAKLK